VQPEQHPSDRRDHAGRRDRRTGEQPRRERRRSHEVRRGRARPSSPGPPAHPLGRPGRPAPRMAAAARRLGGDRGAHAALARHRARERERRVVGCADAAPPGLRPRLVVSALLPRVHRSVHSDGPGIESVPGREEQGLYPPADPTLDEVLAIRDEQAAELERWLDAVTSERLQEPAPIPDNDMWPPYARGRSVRQCLGMVLGESSSTISSACATSTSSRDRSLVDAHPALVTLRVTILDPEGPGTGMRSVAQWPYGCHARSWSAGSSRHSG
jgi:hypothetical protein